VVTKTPKILKTHADKDVGGSFAPKLAVIGTTQPKVKSFEEDPDLERGLLTSLTSLASLKLPHGY
jgi:hypothetical protein